MHAMNNMDSTEPLRGYLLHPIFPVILGVGLITDLAVFGILGVRPAADPTNPDRRVMVVTHPDRAPWLTDILTTYLAIHRLAATLEAPDDNPPPPAEVPAETD